MKAACVLPFALFLLASRPAHAQLGGSAQECDQRYAPRIETRKATLPQCEPEAWVYTKGGVTVIFEFMKGKAAHIILRKPVLDPKEVESLLKEFGGPVWSPPLGYEDRQFRLSGDKGALAIILNNTRKKQIVQVDLMLRDCASAGYAKMLSKLEKGAK